MLALTYAVLTGRATWAAETPLTAGRAVKFLIGKVDRTLDPQTRQPKNSVVVTGDYKLGVQKVTVIADGPGDTNLIAYIRTDEFPADVSATLLVKVNDKIFVPSSVGGAGAKYFSVELRNLDRASAETLNGGPLTPAPEKALSVVYSADPQYKPGGRIAVRIDVTNTTSAPLSFFWGTVGDGQTRCRDAQLSFSATLAGAAVPANPKPLPPGFIGKPITLQPGAPLHHNEDLSEWLQFDKAGTYEVSASYTFDIENPKTGEAPARWTVKNQKAFTIEVKE